jgi:hypothetical protein
LFLLLLLFVLVPSATGSQLLLHSARTIGKYGHSERHRRTSPPSHLLAFILAAALLQLLRGGMYRLPRRPTE